MASRQNCEFNVITLASQFFPFITITIIARNSAEAYPINKTWENLQYLDSQNKINAYYFNLSRTGIVSLESTFVLKESLWVDSILAQTSPQKVNLWRKNTPTS